MPSANPGFGSMIQGSMRYVEPWRRGHLDPGWNLWYIAIIFVVTKPREVNSTFLKSALIVGDRYLKQGQRAIHHLCEYTVVAHAFSHQNERSFNAFNAKNNLKFRNQSIFAIVVQMVGGIPGDFVLVNVP